MSSASAVVRLRGLLRLGGFGEWLPITEPRPCAKAGTVPGSSLISVAAELLMSTLNYTAIAQRLTRDRLASYLSSCSGDLTRAIELYDWNGAVGAAFHEDIGRLEMVLRNALDETLVGYGTSQAWQSIWYRRPQLFPGGHGARALMDINTARRRASRPGSSEVHGKVIAELSFGFWRYLCTKPYLTSLWVPALAGAFVRHPQSGDARAIRQSVEKNVERVHFLRNRIAHHEPIHRRDLQKDFDAIIEVADWICGDTCDWIRSTSRVPAVLRFRP